MPFSDSPGMELLDEEPDVQLTMVMAPATATAASPATFLSCPTRHSHDDPSGSDGEAPGGSRSGGPAPHGRTRALSCGRDGKIDTRDARPVITIGQRRPLWIANAADRDAAKRYSGTQSAADSSAAASAAGSRAGSSAAGSTMGWPDSSMATTASGRTQLVVRSGVGVLGSGVPGSGEGEGRPGPVQPRRGRGRRIVVGGISGGGIGGVVTVSGVMPASGCRAQRGGVVGSE